MSQMGKTNGSGFGGINQTLSKEDEWRACLDKASVMKFGPIDKIAYETGDKKCAYISNRFEYSRMIEINRKYRGQKDEIFEAVNTA